MAIIQNEPRCKIQTGTYTGTGTYGVDNPNKLSFSFEPKVIIISVGGTNSDYVGTPLIMSGKTGVTKVAVGTNIVQPVFYTISGKNVSWYSTYRGDIQFNNTGYSYNWVAIG
jgi:hypothetical protein